MPLLVSAENHDKGLTEADLFHVLDAFLEKKVHRETQKILIIPPDQTRLQSRAGLITNYLYQQLSPKKRVRIMPALGTHVPMSDTEIDHMFGDNIPKEHFLDHDWRNDVTICGQLDVATVEAIAEGSVSLPVDVSVNKVLFDDWDLIISVGQIVPHEVIGMANYTKNILVGIGGEDIIHKSHFIGAAYNMEKIMGKADTPVRKVLNLGFQKYLGHLPIEFIHTVISSEEKTTVLRGVYCGHGDDVFLEPCKLSQKYNINLLDKPLQKAVVYLDPAKFKTTWLGNKAIYRTRMAMADDGELIVLAPGLNEFGEDKQIDTLIRQYGYQSIDSLNDSIQTDKNLRDNLSAAAHLVHGSSDGRFKITYCPGNGVSREEIESVGYSYMAFEEAAKLYNYPSLSEGWNDVNGEDIFFISNPALGLWALREKFNQ